MSNLNQPQGNPVQQQVELQQQQQGSPDAVPQTDDDELDTAADEEALPGDGLADVDGDDQPEQTEQVRQAQANMQSDAEPEEGDIYRGAPDTVDAEAEIASK